VPVQPTNNYIFSFLLDIPTSTMGSIETPDAVLVKPSSACLLVHSILLAYGVPSDYASLVADALVLADLRGVDSHGINRLPSYIARVEAGVLDPNPILEFQLKTPVAALLDAKNTFGFVAASLAIDKGIEIASTYGVAIVAVKHSNHYGMASTYLYRAIEQGYAAFAFTNASRSMPPWGAKEPLFGTSPFAVGLPGGDKGDFVLDMSPSVAARGKIRKAARRGESIPEGYALDEHGRPTTDPVAALRGIVLPIGGPKGSGIAMMMDLFGGLLTGAAFKGDVVDMNQYTNGPQNVGHWFLVFRPEVFLEERMEYLNRMDDLMDRVRSCEKAEGVKRIYTSGEIEAERQMRNGLEGIPYTRGEVDALHALAEKAGCKERLETM
jgi:LDH2 family malate/lactate/ureidoglycolate dehydrogenase